MRGTRYMEGTSCNPRVGRLDRTPFFLRGERNLGPLGTQFAADWQDSVPRQVLGKFELPSLAPVPFERPTLQLSQRHEGDPEQSTCDVVPVRQTPAYLLLNSIDTTSVS